MSRSSNREIEYVCGKCQSPTPRQGLHVKRVQFVEMGVGGKMIRSRVVAWLCAKCIQTDPDYNRPKLAASPGMADTRIASNVGG